MITRNIFSRSFTQHSMKYAAKMSFKKSSAIVCVVKVNKFCTSYVLYVLLHELYTA